MSGCCEENLAKQEVDEVNQNSYNNNYKTHRPGITLEETIQQYSEWAKNGGYESDLSLERYQGPVIAAETVDVWVKDKRSLILDVAAGTGFVAEQLVRRGFKNIDALEPSEEMNKQAKAKNLYHNYISAALTNERTNIPDDTYEAVVISGGMGEGHIPCTGLKELIRITKPDGLVIIVMRKEYLNYVKEYKGRLKPFMEMLHQMSYWEQLEEKRVEKYSFNKKDGLVFVFKVKSIGFPNYSNVNPTTMM